MSAALDTTTTLIVEPDGSVATRATVILSEDEARMLRAYKTFLTRHGLREALYCNHCWTGEREDGVKAFVTPTQIGIMCRCKNRFFQGMTY